MKLDTTGNYGSLAGAFRELGKFGRVVFDTEDPGGIGGSMNHPGNSGDDDSRMNTMGDLDGDGSGGDDSGDGGDDSGGDGGDELKFGDDGYVLQEGDEGYEAPSGEFVSKGDFEAFQSNFSKSIDDLKEVLSGKGGDGSGKSDDDSGIKNLLDLEDDDLREKMASDPKGFVSEIAKAVLATVTKESEESTYNNDVQDTFSKYGEKNPDFTKMWDSGELKSFMDKNPGQNAISAHMILTQEAREESTVNRVTKEVTDKLMKDFKEKRTRRTLSGNDMVELGDDSSDALQDTGKFGGAAAVIAQRAGLA